MKKILLVFLLGLFLCAYIVPSADAKGKSVIYNVIWDGDLAQLKDELAKYPAHLKEPLITYAADLGQIEILQYLIAQKLDINQKGWMDMTALSHVLSWGGGKTLSPEKLEQVVTILIDAGADVNSLDLYGQNSVYWAVEFQHPEIAKILLAKGGKPYTARGDNKSKGPNIFYTTALHRACLLGQLDAVQMLIAAGAPADIKNDNLALPIDIARENGHEEIVSYLETLPK